MRQLCLFRQTGRPYHNFISWQDMRSHNFVESWNKSLTLKVCEFFYSPWSCSYFYLVLIFFAVSQWYVCWTLDQAVRIQALAGVILLCPWALDFALSW